MKWYTKYVDCYDKPYSDLDHDIIDEIKLKLKNLQNEDPLVSVILIAHNEERHLVSCIWSLVNNCCNSPMELIAVNNNSTDRTEKILQELGVIYYNELKKGPGYARQCGLNHARGKYSLCIDVDTMYPPYYINTHLRRLLKPNVVCTYSLWSFIPDDAHSKKGLFIYESLRDFFLFLQNIKRPELCVRGMTLGVRTASAQEIGFRTDIIRGEDGYLAFQLKQYGKIVFIHSRKARVMTGYGTLEQDGSLFNSFKIRFMKLFKHFFSMFIKKVNYEDDESNLLDKH